LVAGVSAHLVLDRHYRDFNELMADQIATAISKARAYEEERKRAEALAEIDRAKTAFFSNVSHEFRTPLTLMLGPLEDLKLEIGRAKSPLSNRQYHLLDLVHRNSIRLLKLTNTLLDFARIEAGRVTAAYEKVDLGALTAELLLSGQYEVEAVADGQLALEAIRRKRPDLILSDIMMPRLDGFGLLEGLREKTELRDIPMIFLSGKAGEEAKVEGLRRGADDYLVKPFSARELIARVEANIELSASDQSEPACWRKRRASWKY
jgi:CheY-like chemotaxis protein